MNTTSGAQSAKPKEFGVAGMISSDRSASPIFAHLQQGEAGRTISLQGLTSDLEHAKFYMDDHFNFSVDPEFPKEKIQFNIKTHCLEPENQTSFQKNITLPFKTRIDLIELIPEEVFIQGKRWWEDSHLKNITCEFEFTARNENEDLHLFTLPHLPIQSFEDGMYLNIIENSPQQFQQIQPQDLTKVPIVQFEHLNKYSLLSDVNRSMDQLHLMCETFAFTTHTSEVIHYDLWKLQQWHSIPQEDRRLAQQACRFISLKNNQVVGVSPLFPLVFPAGLDLSISIVRERDLQWPDISGVRTIENLKKDFKEGLRRLQSYAGVSAIDIENDSETQTFHVWMPQPRYTSTASFLYYNMPHFFQVRRNRALISDNLDDQCFGYYLQQETETLAEINHETLFLARNNTDDSNSFQKLDTSLYTIYEEGYGRIEGFLLTLPPSTTIRLPLSFRNIGELCSVHNTHKTLGILFELNNEDIQAYRVLNSQNAQNAAKTALKPIRRKGYEINASVADITVTARTDNSLCDYSDSPGKRAIFFKNTCFAAERNEFSEDTIADESFIRVLISSTQAIASAMSRTSGDPEWRDSIQIRQEALIQEEIEKREAAKRRRDRQAASTSWPSRDYCAGKRPGCIEP